MSVEIIIDPNVRVAGNRTYGGFEDVLGGFVDDLAPGDAVTVLEEESGVIGDATVYDINFERQLVYLDVDWASLRPRQEPVAPVLQSVSALVKAKFWNAADHSNIGVDATTSAGAVLAVAG